MELYKKYRPKRFSQIIGNEATVNSLSSMCEKENLPHTLLFYGDTGCGKTTLARIVKRELGCHDMDFVEMNCSSFRGIDTIRDIMRTMNLVAMGGGCRVWLLDEVHQLSKDAQHASLKMLEDTPSHVYFLLCTTEPKKLLPTVRNRCMMMPVEKLSECDLARLIVRVAKKEKMALSEKIISDLSEISDGSPRRALVILDKMRSLPEKEWEKVLQEREVEEQASIDLCRALIKRRGWGVVSKILKNLKGEPESIRWAVLGYARACLLRGEPQAYEVICAFENHFYDSKHAGLARACYEAIHGDE